MRLILVMDAQGHKGAWNRSDNQSTWLRHFLRSQAADTALQTRIIPAIETVLKTLFKRKVRHERILVLMFGGATPLISRSTLLTATLTS